MKDSEEKMIVKARIPKNIYDALKMIIGKRSISFQKVICDALIEYLLNNVHVIILKDKD